MSRIILAFNGDLESRLALHWLSHERGFEVVALSLNLGQEIQLQSLGELALELGASAARIVDRRTEFLRDFAVPVLQADAVYQGACFLGSALSRYVIARELVLLAQEQGCTKVAHSSATRGNDQVRLEAALAALEPKLEVLAPVREWNLRTLDDKLNYARRRKLAVEEAAPRTAVIDRNLWGASIYLDGLDPWEEPPAAVFTLTRKSEDAPDQPAILTLGFEEGVPVSLETKRLELVPLVRELNRLGGEHGIGRSDVMEDSLSGLKSREYYESPAATLLRVAHRDLESLVQSREMIQMKDKLGRRYAELVYGGQWFHDLRRSLQGFFAQSQRYVTGEVRLRVFKGACHVVGRRSPHSLYDGGLSGRAERELLDGSWARAVTALSALPARLAARRQPAEQNVSEGGWAAP